MPSPARSYLWGFDTMKILRRSMLSLTLGLTTLFAGAAAGQQLQYEGWLYGEEADEALEYAQERDIPVALMYAWTETSCGLCMGAARTMAASRPNRQMVRIIYYYGPGSENLNTERVTALWRQADGQVNDPSNWIPDLYYLMPDGQVLGYVPYEDASQTTGEANTVLQIVEWMDSVTGTLARADGDAERGRYAQALERIEEVVDRDARVSHIIQQLVGRADERDEMPAQPVVQFFPNLLEEKRAEYAALAMEALAEARQLYADGEDRQALAKLRLLTRAPESFEATAAAQALVEEIMEARRAAQ